jgi:hypothetical protein
VDHLGGRFKGTIEFVHDAASDIVIERPRWVLNTAVEVMRWYQLQAGYFSGRFKERKDVIVVDDGFDVSHKVSTLWGQYRARLHELYIRRYVRVGGGARVQLATNTSTVRYSISSVEKPTVEEAIAFILQARKEAEPGQTGSGSRGRMSKALRLSSASFKAKGR